MVRYPNIKKVINKLIDEGKFIIKDNEIVFIIDKPGNKRYIYKTTNGKYRVLITDPENSDKKIHVGYYDNIKSAIEARDTFLMMMNKKQ